ncbi:oxygen-independent coproporphyrinogen-3 oxidase [Chitinophaga terrae (ex Kim and Jung 2007)]|uniref:Coproporphyrinogen-III oxidase n=1 Tax=Chitinophaga terrae (ex Kim and Jung 2007) TaxID=408074 RepID=A0A1H4FSE9_9BACT|nr:oxygen-independent coproporphyrinogen III oxidase [Chitinophaga terrae (ex Kim and Jung 2007)]GEP92836.1 coproporphyrinogen-III oxidase [Chitinophaga terrae (ex Kim and Jung 2007)]SEB00293.1 oxygen-independent coproporphyrinogen-3 oxidase [Chitinophaga terrae (ex Kim and Jung 2007)]
MSLISKYNVAAPRYTSYPTVPYWDEGSFDAEGWKMLLKRSFTETNDKEGISLYIHLPFCEKLCTYCGCNKYITVNHQVEEPYIDTLLKEWKMYLAVFGNKPRIKEIHLGGGTPTFFSAANLGKLLKGIYNSAVILPDASLSVEGHPGNTTAAHLQTLFDLGFRRISLGIQDFDSRVQEVINRIQPVEMVAAVVENARRIGFTSINFDLIYGLPLQTPRGMRETISEVVKLRPDRISFYSYAHVPWIKGTGQRRYTEADLPQEEEKRKLYELGKSLFYLNGYTEIGMDHFALPGEELHEAFEAGTLHRNFMGYTVSHTSLLVGLGASAIGDNWYAYVQNEKQVHAYQEKVNKGEFPLVKGHILNTEDLLLRRHIHNLMCNFETQWQKADTQCDAIVEGLQRLQEPEKDELVKVLPHKLVVTPKGKPFIRNICMAFDARLWRQLPQSHLFSKAI